MDVVWAVLIALSKVLGGRGSTTEATPSMMGEQRTMAVFLRPMQLHRHPPLHAGIFTPMPPPPPRSTVYHFLHSS